MFFVGKLCVCVGKIGCVSDENIYVFVLQSYVCFGCESLKEFVPNWMISMCVF